MDNLPFPRNRSGWIAAIILAILLFLFYYLVIFQGLLNIYEKQFLPVSYPHDRAINNESLALIDINARVPKYVYSAGAVPIYISVTNNNADKTIKNLGVYLVSDDKFPLLLPNLYNKDTLSTGIVFDEIAPRSTVTGRLSFITQTTTKISNVSIVAGSEHEERQPSGDITSLTIWNWKTLQYSFIETILLPPWSNGFILALALFASYLSQSKGCEDDKVEPFTPECRECACNSMKRTALLLLVMVILVASFIFGVLFVLLIDGLLIWMMIKGTVHSNNKKSNVFCIALGVIVILLALALICDNPTPTLLKAAPTAAREVLMSEALWMDFFSGISIVESLVLIVLCVKGGAMPGVMQRGGKTPPPPPPPDLPKPPILGLPERPSPPPNKSKMGKKKKEKKKTNKFFESYDLGIEQRVGKEWKEIKERKIDAKELASRGFATQLEAQKYDEESALRKFVIQLETKKYNEPNWVWRTINFFRPRSDRLQELLDEIHGRIEELEQDKQKEKGKTGKPVDKLPGNSDGSASNDAIDLSETPPDGMPPKPDLGKDTDQGKQTPEDASDSSSIESMGEAEETK